MISKETQLEFDISREIADDQFVEKILNGSLKQKFVGHYYGAGNNQNFAKDFLMVASQALNEK